MLEITIKDRTDRIPIEAECITADFLAPLSVSQIEQTLIYLGNRQIPLAELFQVRGDASDGEIHLVGDWSTVKLVGSSMKSGRLVIHGSVGMHLGAEMSGGTIEVEGNAGDWVGAEMTGGHIHIKGSAGHLVGGAYRGGSIGMRGGSILIEKNAGNEIASGMRRGLIAIGGDCGDFAGVSMIAGSLFIFGKPGIRFGAGMKRGTIALFGRNDPQPTLLPTFRYDCEYTPTFLQIYFRQLVHWGFHVPASCFESVPYLRYNGDMLELGKGEVLIMT